MQSFYYEVLNEEGQTSRGILSAASEAEARKILKSQGLSILTLEIYQEKNTKKSSEKTWNFLGKNKNGQAVKGSIKSPSSEKALEILRNRYHLTLDYLLPEEETDLSKNLLEKASADSSEKDKHKKSKIPQKTTQEKKLEKIHNEIQRILLELPTYLKSHKNFILSDALRETEERLEQLRRLQHSNSLENLERLLSELDQLVNGKEFFIDASDLSEDAKADLESRKMSLQNMRDQAEEGIVKLLYRAKDIITDVPRERILRILWHPLELIGFVIYMFFFSLFFLLVAFWLYAFLMGVVLEDPLFSFLLKSTLLWIFTSFSAIFVTTFLWVFVEPRPKLFTRLSFIGTGAVALGLLVLEFPIIFFWTH